MKNDFSRGPVWKSIVSQAIPLTLAQLVHLLYNIVDRIYIGHLPGTGSMALTGVGLTFPVITLIAAFTNLFGMGGTPLFSIARGAKEEDEAERILGNVFTLLVASSFILFAVCYLFRRPILFLFGASEASYVYADEYLRIYLFGTIFSMLTTGLNGFINAQGFPRVGMMTTLLGAVLNLVLDPVFIFGFDMGVSGAALATVISQGVSAAWVLHFLTSGERRQRRQAAGVKSVDESERLADESEKPTNESERLSDENEKSAGESETLAGESVQAKDSGRKLVLKRENLKIDRKLTKEIVQLGTAGFIMQGTNCLVQVVCNASLQNYGGDLYVGIMTVLNSVREVLSLPVSGISSGSQPVLGYNFGAKEFGRVKAGIRFMTLIGFCYTVIAWLVVMIIPKMLFRIFSSDPATLEAGPAALNLYFFGFFFMAFQFGGQSVFQGLGYAKKAIFFSLFRKVIIVVPLTLLLPALGLGVNGVFLAEPISNAIGGLACFITMWRTVYRKL